MLTGLSPEDAALHEAGHAVAYVSHGFPFREVCVSLLHGGTAGGEVEFAEGELDAYVGGSSGRLKDLVMALLVGQYAQVLGGRQPHPLHVSEDEDAARKRAAEALDVDGLIDFAADYSEFESKTCHAIDALVDEQHERAQRFVAEHEQGIRLVAARLLQAPVIERQGQGGECWSDLRLTLEEVQAGLQQAGLTLR